MVLQIMQNKCTAVGNSKKVGFDALQVGMLIWNFS